MKQHLCIAHHLLLVLAMLCISSVAEARNWLFRNGKSPYTIVLSPNASVSERTAAHELQTCLRQISGAELPIVDKGTASGRCIYVGFSPLVERLTGDTLPPVSSEAFTYRTVGKHLLIYGGAQRGTMYGVFAFLEEQLGVHWLTPQYTHVPQRTAYALPRLHVKQQPAIAYRYSNYFNVDHAPEWSAHNRENMKWGPQSNNYGNIEAYWNAHTMGQLVPSREFFASHPEYFSLRDGKRIPDGQLCLSNPQVLQLCKERLAQKMRTLPGYRIYSLSQNDNYSFCQCAQCAAIEAQYGGHSGLLLWFVNQVADAVRHEFPDKYVGTFAYQYTRRPPIGITPRSNVVIRLCSIECCFAHPLTAGCPQNKAFMDDLRKWSEIAPHLFIWDYIVNYYHYIAPWPNFQVLGPNIETFRQHKAIGIFEEAQYQSLGAEFEELKSWVVTKLLWNPQQNTDSLVQVFVDAYYGKAAPKVMEYYRLCQSLVTPDVHYGIYIREGHEIYTDDFIRKAFVLLNEAQQMADDDEVRQRVDRVRMQPLYLHCVRHKVTSRQDGTWQELKKLLLKYNARPGEVRPLDKFIQEFESVP